MKTSGSALLFGFEVVLLFLAVGNCFVPGSWTSFWWTEGGWLGSAAFTAALSFAASRSEKPSFSKLLVAKQSLALLGTIAIVGLLIVTH